jgi:serine/threonine protein kinase
VRTGDVIGGYALLEEFRVVGAGLSEWTFAERDGREYFLKRFLSPTYPEESGPGSEATKARKRAKCAAFEAHHRGIQAALAPVTSYGGNLVATLDFFRQGAKYYKVTERVDVAGLHATDIARLPLPARLVLLKTVAHSLRILHELGIVHSDLKPSNVLVKRTERGHTTKLIDFDSSYLAGRPPPPDEITGTMTYYSPEFVRYVQGEQDGTTLTTAADVFALGLVYAEYLTGSLPPLDPAHREAAVAVLNGAPLAIPAAGLPAPLVRLVERMLLLDPAARPTVAQVHAELMALGRTGPTVAAPLRLPARPVRAAPSTASPAPSAPSAPSPLRGRGVRIAEGVRRTPIPPPPVPELPDPATPVPSGLLGRLVHRIVERRAR